MDSKKPMLEALATMLGHEEAILAGLLRLADQMRDALITSDFALLDDAARRMDEESESLDRLEADRERLVSGLGVPAPSFGATVVLADELGVPAIAECRTRLASLALNLQQAQERNAQLVLGAVRLRERWFNILAGMIAPTYGARGRQNVSASRRIVSKSA